VKTLPTAARSANVGLPAPVARRGAAPPDPVGRRRYRTPPPAADFIRGRVVDDPREIDKVAVDARPGERPAAPMRAGVSAPP